MARPPTYEARVAAGQRAAARVGTNFYIYSGAQGRCRCCSGAHNPNGPFIRAWGTWIGVIRHITAGGLGARTMETYIRDILVNDPAVPFKSQWSVSPWGDIWLIGSGRANHCLNMSQQAYDALVNGTFPLDQFCVNMRGSALVGSAYTDGIEQVAATAPTAIQAAATDALEAELFKPYGWTGTDTAGHGEVASDRGPGDPNEHMGNVRTRIKALVSGGTPPPPAGDEIVTPEDINKIAQAVLTYKVPWVDPATGQQGTGQKTSVNIAEVISWIDRNNSEQTKALTKSIEAIPPCNVQIDVNALADRIVSSMGADLASKVIDALGQRINAGGGA